MKINLLLLICLFCGIAYGQPAKIYLSPKAAGGANQSLFIDSIKLYPLEVNKDVSFGSYTYLIITKNYFLAHNYINKEIIVYTKGGRFIKKISYKKLGDRASPTYDKTKQQLVFFFTNKNYALTEKDQIAIKSDFSNKRNKKYYKKYIIDLKDTSFSFQKAEPTSFDILKAYNLKDDYYCTYEIAVSKNYKDTTDYEVKIYKGTEFIKGYFPYNKQKEIRYLYARYAGASTQESPKPNVFYISRPYVDTIYALSDSVVTPLYQVILPMENSVPKSFFETAFKNRTERENFERNNGWLLRQIYLSYETGRYMLFNISFFSNYGRYIYDKKTMASYSVEKIKPDSTSYFLPLFERYNAGIEHEGKFYKILTIDHLKKVYEQNKGKTEHLPYELQRSLKDSTNPKPLIAEYTIKIK